MYYTKEALANLKKEGEEYQKQKEENMKGKKYATATGAEIVCLQCKNPFFHKGKALLNTRGMTLFGLDWLDATATTLICSDCGFVHWFNKAVKETIL